jgi:hypothetical protein
MQDTRLNKKTMPPPTINQVVKDSISAEYDIFRSPELSNRNLSLEK